MVPEFLLGVDLTYVAITPLTKNGDGSFTPGSTQEITVWMNAVDPSSDVETEDVRPVNQYRKNLVPTGEGDSCRVDTLQRSDADNIITSLCAQGYRYFQLDWVQGTEPAQFRGLKLGWNGGVKNRGGNVCTLSLGPIAETSGDPNLVIGT